jgi:hypothetical protein
MPAMQLGMVQQAPDLERLNEIAAQYANLPEIRSIMRMLSPDEIERMQGGGMGMGGDGPKKSPTSTRHYVRHGAPGPTRAGNAMQAMTMMGKGNGEGASG